MTAPILTLTQIKALDSEARSMEQEAWRAKRLEQQLAEVRTGEKPLMVFYKSGCAYHDELRSAIEGIINEHGADLLRIVEMRQAAFARGRKIKAGELRAQLATVVAPEPEVSGGAS